jgi:hypothetical protein
LAKLVADRPSTAFVGNWGILESIAHISEQHGFGTTIAARLFMGKKKLTKTKLEVPLSKKDTEPIIDSQWESLR